MRLYLDASAIIYAVEGAASVRQTVLDHIRQVENSRGKVLTSRLSRLECRVHPLRRNDAALLAVYDHFFARHSLDVGDITSSVIERATDLRARLNLKTPDAIHVATAIELQADVILTGDRDFTRCTDVNVVVV